MNPKKDLPPIGPNNRGVEIVVVDDSNSVFDGTRRPAREFIRKAVRERFDKEKKLLELREKMYGKRDDGQNGKQADSNVSRID
jgi:hypothetical protein